MQISRAGTFLESMPQNQITFAGEQVKSLRNIATKAKENNESTEAISKDEALEQMEKITDMASASISNTLRTLEGMKSLAITASGENVSNDERIDLQKKMTELQFQLHENASSIGLNLAGKSYEDISPMKTKSVIMGQSLTDDFDANSFFETAEEYDKLTVFFYEDAEYYTWGRDDNGRDYKVTSYVRASKEEIESQKAKKINFGEVFRGKDKLFAYDKMISSHEAQKTVSSLDKKIEKINKMQEEISEFNALGDEEKYALFTPSNNENGIYSSSAGDTVSISYGYADKKNGWLIDAVSKRKPIKKMSEEPWEISVNVGNSEYIQAGDGKEGSMVRRDIWEARFKKTFSLLGEMQTTNSGDPYDFRIKNSESEFGKMVQKWDTFLKDDISGDGDLGLFIGNFWNGI